MLLFATENIHSLARKQRLFPDNIYFGDSDTKSFKICDRSEPAVSIALIIQFCFVSGAFRKLFDYSWLKA
jgi:hypothetical protein